MPLLYVAFETLHHQISPSPDDTAQVVDRAPPPDGASAASLVTRTSSTRSHSRVPVDPPAVSIPVKPPPQELLQRFCAGKWARILCLW